MAKTEKSNSGLYFLIIVILIYIATVIIKPSYNTLILKFAFNILIKIIPIFILIFIIMFIINYFITPKYLVDKLEKNKGIKAWTITIIAGIISTGPIYMWYPLLSELKEHGINQGLIATFLYARAIKPALLPLMIFYFGLKFTITLTIVMIIFSVIQGKVIEKMFRR